MALPVFEPGHTTTQALSGTSATVTAASGIAVDDLLVLVVCHDAENQTFTFPAGFTEALTDGFRFESAIAWKIAVSADTSAADYTVSWTASDSNSLVMMRISGVDTTSPINITGSGTAGGTGVDSPSVTTTVDDCLVLVGCATDDSPTWTIPTGTSAGPDTTGQKSCLAVAYFDQVTAGATGIKTWGTGANEEWSWTMAIAPDAGGGGGAIATPPAGSVTYTGLAPVVTTTANQLVEIPAGSTAYTGFPPTVEIGDAVEIEIPTGSTAYTGFAPTVEVKTAINIDVPAGSITYTGFPPQVLISNPINIEIPTGDITYTGYAPKVTIGAIQTPDCFIGLRSPIIEDGAAASSAIVAEIALSGTINSNGQSLGSKITGGISLSSPICSH